MKLARTVQVLEQFFGLLARLVFWLLLLFGCAVTMDRIHVYRHAAAGRSVFAQSADGQEISPAEISADCAARLVIDGTSIDYPVMQGRDNREYLNKDPYGNFALSGSVFLDFRCSRDFTDAYSLIYGHHMDHGAMFGALDAFADPDYFAAHSTGTLFTADERTLRVTLFAFAELEATAEEVFAPTENDGPLRLLRERASIWYEIDEDARIVGLATCKSPDSLTRICVFGVLTEE